MGCAALCTYMMVGLLGLPRGKSGAELVQSTSCLMEEDGWPRALPG